MLNRSKPAKARRIKGLATVRQPGARQIAHIFPENTRQFCRNFPGVFEGVEKEVDSHHLTYENDEQFKVAILLLAKHYGCDLEQLTKMALEDMIDNALWCEGMRTE